MKKVTVAKKSYLWKGLLVLLIALILCGATALGIFHIREALLEENAGAIDFDSVQWGDYPFARQFPNQSQEEYPLEEVSVLTAEKKEFATPLQGTPAKRIRSPRFVYGPPYFQFPRGRTAMTAKATEELPGIYQTLTTYDGIEYSTYRIFRVKILESHIGTYEGEFYLAIPAFLKGDLTKYDKLLVAVSLLGQDYILLNTETRRFTSFELLLTAWQNDLSMGSIIPYTDGVFDPSLWQNDGWSFHTAKHYLEDPENHLESLLVTYGTTWETSVKLLEKQQKESTSSSGGNKIRVFHYTEEEAIAAEKYATEGANGLFHSYGNLRAKCYIRYLHGCPTNEYIQIDSITQNAEHKNEFTEEEIANLPNLSQYIASLNLDELQPDIIDPEGKERLNTLVKGWYHKTEKEICAIVKIAWVYEGENKQGEDMEYREEQFFLLTEQGAEKIPRRDLMKRIGGNPNISLYEYGKEEPVVLY